MRAPVFSAFSLSLSLHARMLRRGTYKKENIAQVKVQSRVHLFMQGILWDCEEQGESFSLASPELILNKYATVCYVLYKILLKIQIIHYLYILIDIVPCFILSACFLLYYNVIL